MEEVINYVLVIERVINSEGKWLISFIKCIIYEKGIYGISECKVFLVKIVEEWK